MRYLHIFDHGLGDAVAFTSLIRHMKAFVPGVHAVAALRGKDSAFHGLADEVYELDKGEPPGPWDRRIRYDWWEADRVFHGMPSTKLTKALRDVWQMNPAPELLAYTVNVREDARARAEEYASTLPDQPFALLHYEGNTSSGNKNLTHEQARSVCDYLVREGVTPVVLDWDGRSPIPDGREVFNPGASDPLWMGRGIGDAETLAALCKLACVVVAIDSGPQKVAFASGVPTVAVWTRHHPIHYADSTPSAVHVVPSNHRDYIRGDKDSGESFFRRHYRHETYTTGWIVETICHEVACLLGKNVMTFAHLLRAKSYGVEYYEEHRAAGLDYLGHGDWQEEYGRWIVDALGMKARTVLDVGCACGSIAAGLGKAGAFVSGCDVNEHMIKLGRERWLADQLKICDACNLHYWGDSTFDLIHSNQVFEHIRPVLVPIVLAECHRVSKPGGKLLVILDTEELFARQGRTADENGEHGGDATHVCIRSLAWWAAQCEAAGWMLRPDLFDALKAHERSYWRRYDWDGFLCVKH